MTTTALRARKTLFLTVCVMGFFAIMSSVMAKSPVLKPFAAYLSTPTDWTGIVASASTIPGILVSLPAASLSDIYGRKRFLLLAGVIFASAPFFYLLITVWWQLILVRFYHGFATAIFVPVAEASVAELFPEKMGERISLFSSATYVGRVSAPTIGGYILYATSYGFNVLYSVVAAIGFVALLVLITFLVSARREERAVPIDVTRKRLLEGWTVVLGNKGILVVSLVQAALYYSYGAAEFYLAGYIPEVAHQNAFVTGIVLTSIIGVAILARPYIGRISDRTGRRLPIAIGCVVASVPLLLIHLVVDFWTLLGLAIVYGIGYAAVTSSTSALVSELTPKSLLGTAMGVLDTIMDIGMALGTAVSGLILATQFYYAGVFSSLGIVLLFAAGVFVLSGVGMRRNPSVGTGIEEASNL